MCKHGFGVEFNSFNTTNLIGNPLTWWRNLTKTLLGGVAVAWCLCGCVHHDANAGREAEVMLPKLRMLIAGPTAILLTNLAGFQSECVISLADANGAPRNYSGRLFAREGKLRLDTVPGKSKAASTLAFGVIWDATSNRGYVFSDALQGYAVLAGSDRFTNFLTSVAGQPEKMDGHVVDNAEVTAIGLGSQIMVLQLKRAQDLGNLPLQIRQPDEPNSFTLRLVKIQTVVPPEEIFLPPDGFTKYESETAMLEELVARQHNVFESKPEGARTREGPGDLEGQHRNDSNGPH